MSCHIVTSAANNRTYSILGVIITGGNPDPSRDKVELYNPFSGTSCPLPVIPGGGRSRHTSCSNLLCGGEGSPASEGSCVKISAGRVSSFPSIKLRQIFMKNIKIVEECLRHLWQYKYKWIPTTLSQGRRDHLCWNLPVDQWVFLLGGTWSPKSTELLTGNSSIAIDSFNLQNTK